MKIRSVDYPQDEFSDMTVMSVEAPVCVPVVETHHGFHRYRELSVETVQKT